MISDAEFERRIVELTDRMREQVAGQAMSPLERAFKVWTFQEPDRLLGSFAIFSPLCLGITDVTTREYYQDPLRMYYVQAVSAVDWCNEVPLMYADPYHVEIEAMGGEIAFPEDSIPTLGKPLQADQAAELGLVTFTPDELDWDEELRIAIEERTALSPDALTGMEASLRFAGSETMDTRIFGRLTAWQNWIFNRPNAVGEAGALKVYGTGAKAKFNWERV